MESMKKKNIFQMLVAAIVCFVMIAAVFCTVPSADAAGSVYGDSTTIAMIYDQGNCYSMQGFGIYGNYLYSIKIDGSTNAEACIARTHKDTGATTYLTNTATGTKYYNYLGHANDLDMANVGGQATMFVATTNTGSNAIVRLAMNSSSTGMTKVGSYNVTIGGAEGGFGGINVIHVDSEYVTLMMKAGGGFYVGKVGVNQTSGTIEATKVFNIDVSDLDFGGTHKDLSAWVGQGFGYHDNKIYVPITGNHATETIATSAIAVYNVDGASGTIKNDPAYSFWFESKDYPGLFEIESVDICPYDGKLYFNTNSRLSSSQTNYDAVHVVDTFVYQPDQRSGTVGNYRWEVIDDVLTPVTTDSNAYGYVTMRGGQISGGTMTAGQYVLSEPIILKHDLRWIVEWKSSGGCNHNMLMATESSSNVADHPYLFRSANNDLIALGYLNGGKNYNYGVRLADYGIDGTAEHVYRLTNELNADGSNMAYLSVDGKVLGPMNNYYLGLTSQNTTSDWVSGKDFKFSYFGTYEYAISKCKLDYIQVWGNGGLRHMEDDPDIFRWEVQNDAWTTVSQFGLTKNTPTLLTGSISGGVFNACQYKLTTNVVLLHERPWVIEWQSEGNFSGGAMLLAAHNRNNSEKAPFLFRYSGSSFLGFGCRDGGQHTNYGVKLSDYGIDGTAAHVYRLTNKIAADGSNMVYLSVDGKEIGPMNQAFQGISALGTTSNWLSGRDFTFSYMGTWQSKINDGTIGYFQVWENGIYADHEPQNYRWEPGTGTMNSITDGFTENPMTLIFGSIADNTITNGNLKMEKAVILCHDKPWSIRWKSGGFTGASTSADMVLSSTNYHNRTNSAYLLRSRDGNFIGIGVRDASANYNYGLKLSDYGIDSSVSHSYMLANRVAADGSNMVYLYVDDQEVGALDNSFVGLSSQNKKSNWVSGKDFTFSYMGTYNYLVQKDTQEYFQINEDCSHSFGAWKETPATCTENGSKTRTCSICGLVESETIASTGHSYKSVVTAPTCTEGGYTTYTCSACGHSYTGNETASKGHSYSGVVTAPTCTKNGYTTYTCSVCSHSYVGDYVTTSGHSYKSVVTAPTCTEGGYTTYTCTNCSYSYTGNATAAAGHNYASFVTDPTCTEGGYTTYTCFDCGHSYTGNETAAKGHSYKTVVTAPTCTKGGYTTYTCACGDSYTADQTAAAGHSFANGSCTVCGEKDPSGSDASTVVAYLSGDMNGWSPTGKAMTGTDGVTVSTTISLSADSYEFKIVYDGKWYGNNGTIEDTTTTSSNVGWEMTIEGNNCTLVATGGDYTFSFNTQTKMLVVTFVSNQTEPDPIPEGIITLNYATLSLEDEVLYNIYYVTENVNTTPDKMGLLLWDEYPANPTVYGGGKNIPGAVYNSGTNMYMVQTDGIPGKELGDNKYIVVYAKLNNGSYVYSRILAYSAKSYCLNRLENSSNANLKALCVAILNYGAAAQEYFAATTDYTYSILMNADLTEEQKAMVKPYSSDMVAARGTVTAAKAGTFGTTSTATGFSGRGASMSADGIFSINYYFTTATAVSDVTMYYWNSADFAAASTLTTANATGSKAMTATGVTNQFWADVDGIAAKDLDKTIYVCGVYTVNGTTYSTGVIPYSLGYYCVTKAQSGSDVMKPMAAATAVYSYYAKTYFGT